MAVNWKPNEFKLGINMAGAISAGAYTAGVLDFLMEALEQWQNAKDAFRDHLKNPAPAEPFANPVPLHDVSIEVFSGASAGGMCAAIASAMIQGDFVHITNAQETGTDNTFYEAWVNQIDISKLLTANDLAKGAPLVSLLDSTILADIAAAALNPGAYKSRPYVSKSLTLFLTLTNVRGVPYPIFTDPSTIDEFTTYYADRLRFETVEAGQYPSTPVAKPLPLGKPDQADWPLLQKAAIATGAFPIFLAPRKLTRDLEDYKVPGWIPLNKPNPGIRSDLPGPPATTWETLNVDGGVTDNDPFQLAHDFLAMSNPDAEKGANPREPLKANCAVLSVAPFPSVERYDKNYDVQAAEGIFPMLARLVTVLISQSRFLGESLEVLTSGSGFSRFVIAPSDPSEPEKDALQCGKLGAFGGFMERSFRAHDFLLGRYNCQRFLSTHFVLPIGNPVIDAGQTEAGKYAGKIAEKFTIDRPTLVKVPPPGKVWMPLIPLMGTASTAMDPPARGKISKQRIQDIADQTLNRLDAIKGPLLEGAPLGSLLKAAIAAACGWPARQLVTRPKIADTLTAALVPDVTDFGEGT